MKIVWYCSVSVFVSSFFIFIFNFLVFKLIKLIWMSIFKKKNILTFIWIFKSLKVIFM